MKRTRTFSEERTSAAEARRFVLEALGTLPGDVGESLALMVSELATNCIRHAQSTFEIAVERSGGVIRVEATDRAGGDPAIPSTAAADFSGRGLKIVEMLADEWGVRRTKAGGKTVWFTMSLPAADAGGAARPASRSRKRGSRAADGHRGPVKSEMAGAGLWRRRRMAGGHAAVRVERLRGRQRSNRGLLPGIG